jgi:hypothetical protein
MVACPLEGLVMPNLGLIETQMARQSRKPVVDFRKPVLP